MFQAPCTREYGCDPARLELYARDPPVDFVRCGSCGLIWRDTDSCNTERQYDQVYFEELRRYDRKRERRIMRSHTFLAILEQSQKPGKMLEVGPAYCYLLEAAQQRGWQAEGLDISQYVVDFSARTGFDVSLGSLENHRLPHGTYDAIVMKHVLEHYRDPFAAMQEVHALLAEGGHALIIVPNAQYRRAVEQRGNHKFYSHAHNGIDHFVYFDQGTLAGLLKSTGFEVCCDSYPESLPNTSMKSQLDNLMRRMLPHLGSEQEIFAVAKRR